MKGKGLFLINFIVVFGILAWYGLLLAQKVDLTTADLGRHLENGKLIIHGSGADRYGVLTTNFYSYTQPEFPFINHHWGSGVVFYLIYLAAGFKGLSLFYILMGAATLWLFFDVARRSSNLFIATVITITLMPLLASRAEVRPEMLTYFFTAVFYSIVRGYADRADNPVDYQNLAKSTFKSRKDKSIWFLPVLMLVWVNLHIGFVFGFLVLGAFWVEELARAVSSRNSDSGRSIRDPESKSWIPDILRPHSGFRNDRLKRLTITGILCVLAALINPNFIRGLVYPLAIFKNYGYLIVENQSIRFLENIGFTQNQHFLLFKIIVVAVIATFIGAAVKNWRKISIASILLVSTAGVMAYNGIRHFPSFAFFALPALAGNIYLLVKQAEGLRYKIIQAIFIPAGLFIAAVFLWQGYQTLLTRGPVWGIGLLPGAEESAQFFKAQNIQGPVFNDYDVGGYLIYNLWSTDDRHSLRENDGHPPSVFVDNRPEAYSNDFFQKIYIPAQQDPAEWKRLDAQYNFNAIFFSHRDYTPWAQAFLIARVQDPAWAPVYVDAYNIIFVKRNERNQTLITKFEISKERFGVRR